jgi:disulfide bond formation protein DsbB
MSSLSPRRERFGLFSFAQGERPMSTAPAPASPTAQAPTPFYAWAAVALAGAASFGGLYLSFVEGKFPCPLCFYQRSFALGVLAVMLVGLLAKLNEKVSIATLALPLAFAGLGVALWHVNLERDGKLECPSGMFGLSTAPKQSAILFGLLCAALVLDAYQPGRPGSGYAPVIGGAVLGVAMAYLCWSNNPQPKRAIPAEEYESPPVICRPPLVKDEK